MGGGTGELDAGTRRGEPSRRCVLVVEDDVDIREAMSEVLALAGYDVRVAADGLEAFALLRAGLSPDAMILDLMMPGLDGWELLSRVRQDARLRAVRVAVASAVAHDAPRSVDAVLQKPFDVLTLRDTVARLTA